MVTLKELKIPKYVNGTSYDDYIIKLLIAASTRGKMKQVLQGDFMAQMPHMFMMNIEEEIGLILLMSKRKCWKKMTEHWQN